MGEVVDLAARRAARSAGEPWLSKKQAAAHLGGVTVRTLSNWQRTRDLPFHRVGGVNLYRASELDVWVARQATGRCGTDSI